MLSAILLQNTPEAMALTKSFLVALLTTSMLVADEATSDGERERASIEDERVDEKVYKMRRN